MIEPLNPRFRQVTRRRRNFPDEDAALKALYLVIRNPIKNQPNVTGKTAARKQAINSLASYYGEPSPTAKPHHQHQATHKKSDTSASQRTGRSGKPLAPRPQSLSVGAHPMAGEPLVLLDWCQPSLGSCSAGTPSASDISRTRRAQPSATAQWSRAAW
ncbi:hypothetical protein ABIA33_001352 [Streptacidiphilus sp. MAP12-16]